MNAYRARPTGVPGYRLIQWIGASGSAAVYAATELSSGRVAAVKIFHRVDLDVLARLERLLQASARIPHPNIVGIRAIGHTADGHLFHSMPLLFGFERTRRDVFGNPRRTAMLVRDLLDGLDHAHRHGMLHGGIKPSNILFDKQGHAHLADFGIARCMCEAGLPRTGATRYLSPEQVHGDPPGPRSDLYSVGMLACELLAGRLPLHGRNSIAPATVDAGQSVPRLPPRACAWQAWLDRAMAEPPERRFHGAREMAVALGAVLARPGYTPRTAGGAQRQRASQWAWPAAILASLIAALAGWAPWSQQPAPATIAARSAAAATTAGNPASTTTAAQSPVSAPPAVAGTASPLAERVQGLVATADTLRASGHLFSPPFHNAASHYLAALAFDPGNRAAMAGIDAILATLRDRLDNTWNAPHGATGIVDMVKLGDELAEHTDPRARREWRRYHNRLARRVGDAVVQAARAHDSPKVAALEPLAKALPAKFPAGSDLAGAQRLASARPAGEDMRDPGGPRLVYVPASGNAPAFAIARVEVTRADYAVFAHATHRPASRCRVAHNPFSRLRHLSWQAPGFAQGDDHPVVCVSWDDAAAYVAWLSKTTSETYRLPSSQQWLRAAQGEPKGNPCKLGNVDDASRRDRLDVDRLPCNDGAAQTAPVGRYAASGVGAYDMYGNVREWLAGGSPGSRLFRGLSWRDGSRQTPLGREGTADSDVGYTNVGFRVVRVLPTQDALLSTAMH